MGREEKDQACVLERFYCKRVSMNVIVPNYKIWHALNRRMSIRQCAKYVPNVWTMGSFWHALGKAGRRCAYENENCNGDSQTPFSPGHPSQAQQTMSYQSFSNFDNIIADIFDKADEQKTVQKASTRHRSGANGDYESWLCKAHAIFGYNTTRAVFLVHGLRGASSTGPPF